MWRQLYEQEFLTLRLIYYYVVYNMLLVRLANRYFVEKSLYAMRRLLSASPVLVLRGGESRGRIAV